MKFLKSIFGAFSETKRLPGLISEAEKLYRNGNFTDAILKADEALALRNAFAPRTTHILYLKAAALVILGNNTDAIETWKSILHREPSEFPPSEFYPVLKQILPEIAGQIYSALINKNQPGSYYLRLSGKDNKNYTVKTNSLFVKEEIKYMGSFLAAVLFIVSKQSTLELSVYYENSADGGVDSELVLNRTFTQAGKE